MQTFAQAIDLVDDPELIAEYERHHAAVWPETLRALRAIGIRRMRIWRLGTRLFMVYEAPDTFDPARDFQAYARDERAAAWDRLMRRYQRRAPGARRGEWWAAMPCVFEMPRRAPRATRRRGGG